jgi:hypothetical protein
MQLKQMLIFSIILLVSVGLSGCPSSITLTHINDINSNPNSYLNKTVTIDAFYHNNYSIVEGTNSMPIQINNDTIKPNYLHISWDYFFIGIVRNLSGVIYLEVTEIRVHAH